MDGRPDTSSGRWSQSHDGASGWSFLHLTHAHAQAQTQSTPTPTHGSQSLTASLSLSPSGPAPARDAQTLSPRSSYVLRGSSDRSSVSPLPLSNGYYDYTAGSRSSRLSSRNLPSASTGARSTTTLPSQPVLSRINSANAYDHNNPFVRMGTRPIKRDPATGLPAIEEFSVAGILAAIQEDVEGDLNTASEILGRNRFVLADEYESQMPPQGEIVMPGRAHAGEDDGIEGREHNSMEDNVMIVNEDASLVDGSHSGSAAYGLLERLQVQGLVAARPPRMTGDAPMAARTERPEPVSPVRTLSSPAVVQPDVDETALEAPLHASTVPTSASHPQQLHRPRQPQPHGPASAIVSETWLSAEADGVRSVVGVPIVSEAGRHYPLYAYEDTGLFETPNFGHGAGISPRPRPRGERQRQNWSFPTFSSLTWWWLRPQRRMNEDEDAEARLRNLLSR